MTDIWLQLAYGANIVILAPVLILLARGPNHPMVAALSNKVADSPGLRLMVFSFWTAILLCSAAGLVLPRLFIGVLAIQVIYKALWLILFVWPLWKTRGPASVPWGPAVPFAAIVALWPFFILTGLSGA